MWLLAFMVVFVCMAGWLLLTYRRQLQQAANSVVAQATSYELVEFDHVAL
jgi:hypothetical protein